MLTRLTVYFAFELERVGCAFRRGCKPNCGSPRSARPSSVWTSLSYGSPTPSPEGLKNLSTGASSASGRCSRSSGAQRE